MAMTVDDYGYERAQIDYVLRELPEDGVLRLKVAGGTDRIATKWLTLNREQVEVLRDTIFPDGIVVTVS
jgi:hypothetical protein